MAEFIFFWTYVAAVFSMSIYLVWQHYKICKMDKQVSKNWKNISQTIERLDEKFKQIQDRIVDSENRMEDIRKSQIETKRHADLVSLSVHQVMEDIVKKPENKITKEKVTVKASPAVNVFNVKKKKSTSKK